MSTCRRCRGMGHILTPDPYNPSGICPECRPKEFLAARAKFKAANFAAAYGMPLAEVLSKHQISEVQAREMLESTKARFGQFKVKMDASLPKDAFRFEYGIEEEKEELFQLYRPEAPWL